MSDRNHRSSNIELLRIVCMLLICLHHFCVHGPWSHISAANAEALNVLSMGGKIGVDCFVLISGFFLITSSIKLKSLIRLEAQTLFYSVLIILIVIITGCHEVGRLSILRAFLPISTSEYWFLTAYVGMYLFSPLINRALASLDEPRYRVVLASGFVMLSAIHTVLIFRGNPFSSDVIWFIYLYSIGGYIRIHGKKLLQLPKRCPSMWLNPVTLVLKINPVLCLILMVCILIPTPSIVSHLNGLFPSLKLPVKAYMGMDTAFCLWASVALFMLFEKLNLRSMPAVNALAGSVFGVYLIHDNPFVRALLWPHFRWMGSLGTPALVGGALLVSATVFVTCAAIDLIRVNCAERPLMNMLDKRLASLYEKTDTFTKEMSRWNAQRSTE